MEPLLPSESPPMTGCSVSLHRTSSSTVKLVRRLSLSRKKKQKKAVPNR
ncbi:unnamed protein product [Dibothriocephalus latus]|uniref:Uncharacterized protein n=1 Tax=Dibothriocephalus latus TaxID=60516 RepID=A0A3P7P1X6_DIBLA|nr:unnamed protein product [Dibothriocephalus latus]